MEREDTTALEDVLQESLRSGTLSDRRAIMELEVRLRQMLLRRARRLIRIGKRIVVSLISACVKVRLASPGRR